MSRRWILALAVILLASACGRARSEGLSNLMDIGVCDPDATRFTVDVDHPFFPLPVGHQIILEGTEFGYDVLLRITVLDEIETVAGVRTRVVEEYEEKDGRPVEVSRNLFAQAEDGTVCYFGEEVDLLDENGRVTSHTGSWRADGDRNLPGIFMPAALRVGQAFQQEVAPGVAEDQAKVVAVGELTKVPAGTYRDTATLVDVNPLDGTQDTKVYARGIGLIVDEAARMTRFSPSGA